MIEPNAPELASFDEELRRRLQGRREGTTTGPAGATVDGPSRAGGSQPVDSSMGDSPAPTTSPMCASQDPPVSRLPATTVQAAIERLVMEKVKYAWDWDTWGSADYIPTVHEMFVKAKEFPDGQLREDCDGRAVMAASLMKRMGYDAAIVTDLRHVWVATPQGDWMGPGGPKTMTSGPQGNQLSLATAWRNVPVSLSYGIAVFPFGREMILLIAAYVLTLHLRMPRWAAIMGGVLLLEGLLFMRCGALVPINPFAGEKSWPAIVGLVHILGGFIVLLTASSRARHPRKGIATTTE